MKYIYQEIVKDNGIILRGVLNTPDDFDPNKKYTTIVFFHGFADDRNGIMFMNVQQAKYLTACGYLVLRFDFSGCGESEGSFFGWSLTRLIEEANLIYEFVLSKDYVNKDSIFIKGHSMGGAISINVAAKYNPRGLILYAPGSDYSPTSNRLTRSLQETYEANEFVGSGRDVGGLELGGKLLTDYKKYDFYKDASNYKGPTLIIRGSEDKAITKEKVEKLTSFFENKKYIEIPDTNHNFTNFAKRIEIFDLTYDFISENSTAKNA